MVDTLRTRTEALALLPDNTSGDISPQDLRDAVVSIYGQFASLGVFENATTSNFTTSISSIQLFALSTSASYAGITTSLVSNDMTVSIDGFYRVEAHLSVGQMNPGTLYQFHILKNGSRIPGASADIRVQSANDIGNVNMHWITSFNDGDTISLGGESDDGGGQSCVISQIQLLAHKVA